MKRPSVTVVIPAYNAERTLGQVLEALGAQTPPVDEVIVVDDDSTDSTAALAESSGARVLRNERPGFVGGARNQGWDAAKGDVVVFLDADAVPASGWGEGLTRAVVEFPGAIVGCARRFSAHTPWGWVAQLQVGTPYLPRGEPRDVAFVASFCVAVPREAPLRWNESFGGEDGIFCADALAAGLQLVFDPRFYALHDHERERFADLRRWQRRLAYGLARVGPVQREGMHKRFFSRIPVHYFLLVRLLLIWRRVRRDPELRSRFLLHLPRMIVAEWTLGFSALRYVLRRPSIEVQEGPGFR
jgi:glycosyltransferase involved in cell wall biosynthesis